MPSRFDARAPLRLGMTVSTLQLGLIVAGVLLVIGVIVYNQWQERRLKRPRRPPPHRWSARRRRARPSVSSPRLAHRRVARRGDGVAGVSRRRGYRSGFEPPVDVIAAPADDGEALASADACDRAASRGHASLAPSRVQAARGVDARSRDRMPDPVAAGRAGRRDAIAGGLNARVSARQCAGSGARTHDRIGSASRPTRPDRSARSSRACSSPTATAPRSRAQIDTFVRVVGDLAPTLPAAFTPPDVAQEVARAESLDRLCAELDVQIGLTVQKPESGSIAGTRLRGVAEAAGFRLAPGGRFELAHEETGAVLYTLQNLRPDPFTAESLRLTATNGVVFLLDVARTPIRCARSTR